MEKRLKNTRCENRKKIHFFTDLCNKQELILQRTGTVILIPLFMYGNLFEHLGTNLIDNYTFFAGRNITRRQFYLFIFCDNINTVTISE